MKSIIKTVSIYGITGLIPSFILVSNLALAEGQSNSGTFTNPFKGSGTDTVPEFLDKLATFLINFGAVVVVFFVVFAGFKFVVAQGNPEKIAQAKQMLFYTLIGGAILLGAKVISSAIKSTIEEFAL